MGETSQIVQMFTIQSVVELSRFEVCLSAEKSPAGRVSEASLSVQRPSVRINLNGDVPSVPIHPSKRKPSLKNPNSGPRVSLYIPEKSSQSVIPQSDSRSAKASFPLLSGDTGSSRASSARRSSIADWLLGCDKASQGRRSVVRCGALGELHVQMDL